MNAHRTTGATEGDCTLTRWLVILLVVAALACASPANAGEPQAVRAQTAVECMADAIVAGDNRVLRPIIAEVLNEPEIYFGRCIVLIGRIVQMDEDSVVLEDLAMRPIKVVLRQTARVTMALNERLLVAGTLAWDEQRPVLHAQQSSVDRSLGGGCSC